MPNLEIPVHSLGFVRLVDSMGNDSSVVQAARVSYGAGTKTAREDVGLIRYLMAHDHGTPFEMLQFKFHVKAPLFVVQQWLRHRIGSFNQESGRYSLLKDEFFIPAVLSYQSTSSKQGRAGALPEEENNRFIGMIMGCYAHAYEAYTTAIEAGVSREQARILLPVATYTQFYWSVNFRSLMNFLRLRLDGHAQQEIRDYAFAIAQILMQQIPLTWREFETTLITDGTRSYDRERLTSLKWTAE